MKLQALYDVEKEIVTALTKMSKKATHDDLATVFTEHLGETRGQIERLEKCFFILDKKPKKMKSAAIRGLIDDAEWMIGEIDDLKARDVSMIASAQTVEHYEIAKYETAVVWARDLGLNDIAAMLEESLGEEKMALEKLKQIADALNKTVIDDDTIETAIFQ
jgi:ferritin-like metal-binding protein YciE